MTHFFLIEWKKGYSNNFSSIFSGYLLRLGLESDGGPAGDGSGASAGPNEASDGLPIDLQGNDRGADLTKGERKE